MEFYLSHFASFVFCIKYFNPILRPITNKYNFYMLIVKNMYIFIGK